MVKKALAVLALITLEISPLQGGPDHNTDRLEAALKTELISVRKTVRFFAMSPAPGAREVGAPCPKEIEAREWFPLEEALDELGYPLERALVELEIERRSTSGLAAESPVEPEED